MTHEIKVEEGKVVVTLSEAVVVDKDNDGKASVEGNLGATIKLDGMEIVDELAKNSDFLSKLKEKFGA